MKASRQILLAALLCGATMMAWAQEGDLYAAATPVADDTLTVRNQAMGEALRQVVSRVSGKADVNGLPDIERVLEQAPSLVQQFRYRLDDQAANENQPPQRYLWVRFDQGGVDRLLRASNIPVWSNRPRVLLWLARERAGQRELFDPQTDPAAASTLRERAEQRGMPLQLPLLDLLDQSALSAADLWSGYEAAIRGVSERYPSEVILSARLRDQGGRWDTQWTLWDRNDQHDYAIPASSLPQALAQGIDRAQDLLAARYAPSLQQAGQGALRVRFSGVADIAAYAQLMRTLGALGAVERFAMSEVEGSDIYLNVWAPGGAGALSDALSLQPEWVEMRTESAVSLNPTGASGGSLGAPPRPVDLSFRYAPAGFGG